MSRKTTKNATYAVELEWFDTEENRDLFYLILAPNLSKALDRLIEVHERYPNRRGPFKAKLLRFYDAGENSRWEARPLPQSWLRYSALVTPANEEE